SHDGDREESSIREHKSGLQTFRLNAAVTLESIIEMANKPGITKDSREFARVCTYTSRVEEQAAMKDFFSKVAAALAVIGIQMAAAPVIYAQIQGSVTHITPVPDGVYFSVDGQSYSHAASAVWPAGSKHILSVETT